MSVTSSSDAGSTTGVSSNSTRPTRAPAGFTGVHGSTCFWPLSAMAANQRPRFSRRRNSRITGFSPLLAAR